jgi:hypothetical protein
MMNSSGSINYTRTGRISKAKKGLKVWNCDDCGRVSGAQVFIYRAWLVMARVRGRGTRGYLASCGARVQLTCSSPTQEPSTSGKLEPSGHLNSTRVAPKRPVGDIRRTMNNITLCAVIFQSVENYFIGQTFYIDIRSDSESTLSPKHIDA